MKKWKGDDKMGSVTKIRDNKPQTVDEWRDYISEPWQKAVESIIDTGKRLIEAKDIVDEGKWVEIFKDNKPFSRQTAFRLIAIAQHSILANVAHAQHLPRSWYTLYELSKIPEHILLELIQNGKVHCELRRSEAEALLKEDKEHQEKVEAYRQIIIGGVYQALNLFPCGHGGLRKGDVNQQVMDTIRRLVEDSLQLQETMFSLAAEGVTK